MNKKLNGFTLLELTVAMFLTTVIVGVGYLGYEIINKQFRQWRGKMEIDTQHMFFYSMLVEDMVLSESCVFSPASKSVKFHHELEGDVRYSFLPSTVIRYQGEIIDTLFIRVDNLKLTFAGENVIVGLFDKMNLNVSYMGKLLPIVIHKNYASQTLLEYGDKDR